MAKLAKASRSRRGQDYYTNVERTYCCTNVKCANITDFGINRLDFQQKEGVMMCSLCGEKAEYLHRDGRLILEKDNQKKIITAKHYGTHSCPIAVKDHSKDVSKIAKKFPRLTRESLAR